MDTDLKVMSKSYKGHKFILVVIDDVTSFIVTISIHQSKSPEVGHDLIERVLGKYTLHNWLIMEQDGANLFALINYLFRKLGINI